ALIGNTAYFTLPSLDEVVSMTPDSVVLPVATVQTVPGPIVSTAGTLYWLNITNGTLMRLVPGGTPTIALQNLAGPILLASDPRLSTERVYVADATGLWYYYKTASGSGVVTVAAGANVGAMAAEGGEVFWVDPSYRAIRRGYPSGTGWKTTTVVPGVDLRG